MPSTSGTLFSSGATGRASVDLTPVPAAIAATPKGRNVVAAGREADTLPVPNKTREKLRNQLRACLTHRVGSREWKTARTSFARTAREVVKQLFDIDLTEEEASTRVAFDHDFIAVHRPIVEQP